MSVAGDSELEERESDENKNTGMAVAEGMSRKEKRNFLKKMKRKQLRRETAIKEREIEEAVLNDPEEQLRLLRLEQDEAGRMERDRLEFDERERLFLLALELKKKKQQEEAEEEEQRKRDKDQSKLDSESNEGDNWEYVEEGPAEIIWKGNEIIVKKKKVKVPKKVPDLQLGKQESERPISNPLAPQSEAFEDYRSAQDVLESVAQEVPNFGTEQDKAHCPFHLKTGVCRFGARCSRVHFYPDKSCTLLIKNMYSGPGLAWEQDEGLEFTPRFYVWCIEGQLKLQLTTLMTAVSYSYSHAGYHSDYGYYTDEEVDRSFEEFYEDVHTEFLKFGEIVNFKVCRNASSHLRGNVYVHYKLLESAVLAYQSINARYFAGKQLSCEFINLTKWKVAICGEFMKSRLRTCSRGSVCNFIHCFRNPGGDYEWADWGKPPPRYWQQEMDALFGDTNGRFRDDSSQFVSYQSKRARSRAPDTRRRNSLFDENDNRSRNVEHHRGDSEALASSPDNCSLKRRNTDSMLSYPSKRSRSKAPDSPHVKSPFDEDVCHRTRKLQLHRSESEEKTSSPENCRIKRIKYDTIDKPNSRSDKPKSSGWSSNSKRESYQRLTRQDSVNREHLASAADNDSRKREVGDRSLELKSITSSRRKSDSESTHNHHQSSEKTNQLDKRKSPRGDRHLCKSRRHESKDSLQKKKETYSSDVDSDGDYLSRDESKRRGRKRSHVKDDAYLSDWHEDRYGRDGTSPESRKSSKSKSRSDFHEFKKRDSLERKEDKYHKSSANSSRATEHIETDGKKPQRSRSQSKRPDNQSDITDSEGERFRGRTDGRYTRNAKNGRQVKHRAESSDSDSDGVGARRYEKKSRKHRISGSELKNDLVQSHLSGLNREKKHDEYGKRNDILNIEECRSSKVDCDAYKRSLDYDKPDEKKQADVSISNDGFEFRISVVAPHGIISEQDNVVNGHCSSSENTAKSYLTNPGFHDQSSSKCGAESHGTCSKGLESTKDQTSYDMDIESTSPVKKCNGTTTPQTVAACFRSTGCLNNEPDTELEKTYRMAALKKLEEMTKRKDVRTVQGRNLNIGAEVHSHAEGSKDLEDISGSGEVGTTAAAAKRRRI